MKPTYEVRAWQEDGWWLARVVDASDGANPAPLNALTQARTLTKIEQMARDLVATILDVDEDTFAVQTEYVLPDEVDALVCEANGARAWLDAAQALWQERSAAAARALADQGFSLRETAKLLGLSYQRVDQLLEGDVNPEQRNVWAVKVKRHLSGGSCSHWTGTEPLRDLDVVLVISNSSEQAERWVPRSEQLRELRERIGTLLADWRLKAPPADGDAATTAHQTAGERADAL
jgi:hypothetical protein